MKICNVCKVEKSLEDFHKKGDAHQAMCKECRKIYIRKHYINNKEEYLLKAIKSREKVRDYFNSIKSILFCIKCGENDIACLDFHHRNPEGKEFAIADHLSVSKERLLKEIEKCEILCANCHRKLHYYNKPRE